ncbi:MULTISPECIES: ABC transporter ATP-binding protein [Alteromonadaceae]|uniref:ABC transporter ATP-binding protein n=1 Tax=Alteromonadaceae TaxID=72275 RepID=UPI001C099066|nr:MULTISPECIES: ABC transporter ATP-binding protein [Aliiglaciecola]MBU2876775.1 ABC transporter ATP-binding protein [Aliiglaciecola lipolytica]MDO6713350.1 ABC transporter ATP-binding protein [Aliiglaciecola sp. 2_MG-2023]MDO6754473.1 ABC transporter ATP-binding protein [Aliiglaciecola sp. 1_MG-2023]
MLQLIDIKKQFQNGEEIVTALDGVTLNIHENEFVAVMGSSGSGKSTLMNVLGCLDTPNQGQYLLAGQDVAKLDDDTLSGIRNTHIGFIFQTFHLLPKLDALGNVLLPLRYADTSEEEAMQRALGLIDRVGISHRKHHKPFEMSGGQRQRVAIARALINQPKVILADEPTGNLDSKTSVEIMALLTELHQAGQTIVMVTHEEEIATYAQRVIRMKDGKIIDEH